MHKIIIILLAGLVGLGVSYSSSSSSSSLSIGPEAKKQKVIHFYSRPNYQGHKETIGGPELASGHCIDVPFGMPALSVQKTEAVQCCLLYRSPCPTKPKAGLNEVYAQSPGLLHQRMFGDIEDLTPFGFDNQVRSVVCPFQVACDGLRQDWVNAGWKRKDNVVLENTLSLRPYWINLQHVPGHLNTI